MLVVVLNYGPEVAKAAIVVESRAIRPRPEPAERSGAIPVVGRAVGLEVVDADLLARVKRPAGPRRSR